MLLRKVALVTLILATLLFSVIYTPSLITYAQTPLVQVIPVTSVGYRFKMSPDNKTIAVFEEPVYHADNQVIEKYLPIRLIDINAQQEVGMLTGHTDYASTVDFTSNGAKMASYHTNGFIYLWDLKTRQPIKQILIGNPNSGGLIEFLPDDKTLAVVRFGDNPQPIIYLWDTDLGHLVNILSLPYKTFFEFQELLKTGRLNSIAALTLSPNGNSVIGATVTGDIWLWDLQTRQSLLLLDSPNELPLINIVHLSMTPDGRSLVYVDRNENKLYTLDVESHNLNTVADLDTGGSWDLSPDGSTIAWLDRDTSSVRVSALSDLDKFVTIDVPSIPRQPNSLAFNGDGSYLIVGGLFTNADDDTNSLIVINLKRN